ncbi:MAG: BrnT family toxin [Brevundimonas sp.]|uniref:BrnT family toxin n=1 Tax=Brevundimonas sp. TaxID=1871086 RepID=UPI000DBC384C|nr:BrnT family toxin [Brevundimonas sp.]PZU62211.1 MAG: BrnT family toxin [Brevundimonas sp.]
MDIEFDSAKDEANAAKHGVGLARAADLEVLAVINDDRRDYGEARKLAFGLIDGVYHCLAYTLRNGRVRAISLRRAHEKEIRRYVP